LKTALLNVNSLIALTDARHVHHRLTHAWFEKAGEKSFDPCPLTQNGALRVLGHPRYPGGSGTPRDMLNIADELCQLPGHVFWPDGVCILDDQLFSHARFGASVHLTDIYLLGLAVANKEVLATVDRKISPKAVIGGQDTVSLTHA
jgi:uncharacterized protein